MERRRKMNNDRFRRQQGMQMKQQQIGFIPEGNQNNINNKMLELRQMQLEAEKREDEAFRRNDEERNRAQQLKNAGKLNT